MKETGPVNIHPWARIGGAPEDRSWPEGVAGHAPEIDASARVSAYCSVDAGKDAPTRIGARSWLLQHVHVGHDAQIGADVEITTGAIIGGHAVISDGVKIGLGAVILPYRTIGPRATIGAGAVVTKDVPAGETWVGNPARRLHDAERDPRPHTDRQLPENAPEGFGISERSDEIRSCWERLAGAIGARS